jgi:TRAP-type C4-dicarboxylate transport system permease small subunit
MTIRARKNLPRDSNRRVEIRDVARSLLLLLGLAALPPYIARYFPDIEQGTDFREFYAAAKLVQAGRGHELYQSGTQNEFQVRYFRGMGTYFNHPPFEIPLYMPFAFFPPVYGHWLWCVFNVGLLMAVAKLLGRHVLKDYGWSIVLLAFLMFVPLLLDFLQGQDSIVLLLVLVSTFLALRNRHEFAGGCLLACGLFKPHLSLPVLVALLPSKGKKFLAGFASVAIILLVISVGICGWSVFTAYPRFIFQSQSLPLAGIHPEQMANLRGLLARIFSDQAPISLGLTLISSLLILLLAIFASTPARRGANSSADLGFANVVMAATLVSYHLSPHDLTILLLPLVLILNYIHTTSGIPTWMRAALIVTSGVVFLPPLDLLLVRAHLYVFASVPILMLFSLTRVEISRYAVGGR